MTGPSVLVSDRVIKRNVGGNTTYANNIIRRLSTTDVRVTACGPAITHPPALRAAAYLTYESLILPRIARRDDFDLLFYPADTGPVFRTHIPSIVTVHGIAAMHVHGIRQPAAQRIWLSRVYRAMHNASRVITVSQSSTKDLVQFSQLPPSRFRVIPHGIDHDRYTPIPVALPDGFPQLAEPYVLFLGNLEPRKNIVSLLRAFDDPRLRATGLRLVIGGKPAWDSAATESAIRDSSAIYLGWVPDHHIVPLLQRATMFAFPSLYEGFGFPVLEAMACGTPVITTRNGSLAEVAGDAACFLRDAGPLSIADKILDLYRDDELRHELRVRGVGRAALYSWDASVAAHKETFTDTASR